MSMNARTPDPERSGVYRTPADVASVLRPRDAPAARWIEVDLSAVRTKGELLEALARAARFPPHFGMNWDALADAVQDLPATGGPVLLRLSHVRAARAALAREWSTLLEILEDASIYYKERDRVFVVFVDDAPELAEWL